MHDIWLIQIWRLDKIHAWVFYLPRVMYIVSFHSSLGIEIPKNYEKNILFLVHKPFQSCKVKTKTIENKNRKTKTNTKTEDMKKRVKSER